MFEDLLPVGILPNVKRIKTVVALVMMAVWLPAQSHCLLERAGWLWSGDCCPEVDGTSESPAKAPCSEQICCNLDSPTYKLDDEQTVVQAPAAFLLGPARPVPIELAPLAERPQRLCPLASPELPVTWQFSRRAALPPRAPSLPS